MGSTEDWFYGFAIGLCLGSITIQCLNSYSNVEPQEQVMVEQCVKSGGELESYDKYSLICVNGEGFLLNMDRE